MAERERAYRRRLAKVTVATLVALGLGYAAVGNPLDPFDNSRFTASGWRGVASPYSRAPMARSAIRHLTVGAPESQVLALLGEPDGVRIGADDGGNKLRGARTLSYSLGSWSTSIMYAFDDAFLYVHLDAAGRVLSAEVTGY